VFRFEHLGEERFARWVRYRDWREPEAVHRLFESIDTPRDDAGVGPAPPETVALWAKLVARMGPDELADFEARTFRQWDRASLSAVRIAIDRRRRELVACQGAAGDPRAFRTGRGRRVVRRRRGGAPRPLTVPSACVGARQLAPLPTGTLRAHLNVPVGTQ
jgi:hypothetical protein